MANTYTQIHIQAVFAVQNRQSLIQREWKVPLFKNITTILQNFGHKMLQINGMADHIHMLFGMRPAQSLSDLMKQVKQGSSYWINTNGLMEQRFSWQVGYGAFSYTKQDVPKIIHYIQNQELHHKSKTFQRNILRCWTNLMWIMMTGIFSNRFFDHVAYLTARNAHPIPIFYPWYVPPGQH